jgi:hypothetical protein
VLIVPRSGFYLSDKQTAASYVESLAKGKARVRYDHVCRLLTAATGKSLRDEVQPASIAPV